MRRTSQRGAAASGQSEGDTGARKGVWAAASLA
jgi:hypothetical protein